MEPTGLTLVRSDPGAEGGTVAAPPPGPPPRPCKRCGGLVAGAAADVGRVCGWADCPFRPAAGLPVYWFKKPADAGR